MSARPTLVSVQTLMDRRVQRWIAERRLRELIQLNDGEPVAFQLQDAAYADLRHAQIAEKGMEQQLRTAQLRGEDVGGPIPLEQWRQ